MDHYWTHCCDSIGCQCLLLSQVILSVELLYCLLLTLGIIAFISQNSFLSIVKHNFPHKVIYTDTRISTHPSLAFSYSNQSRRTEVHLTLNVLS